jgi:hypothetical protein
VFRGKLRKIILLRENSVLAVLLIIHCFASALHFVHNGVFIADYPNLPAWLTASGVYISWCVITSIGASGYVLLQRVSRVVGLALICVYAICGFGGLDHYFVAPLSAHTFAMNATILFEVSTAAVLLVFAVKSLVRELKWPKAV